MQRSEIFVVVTPEEVLLATRGFATRDIATHPTMHRTAAITTRSYLPKMPVVPRW